MQNPEERKHPLYEQQDERKQGGRVVVQRRKPSAPRARRSADSDLRA